MKKIGVEEHVPEGALNRLEQRLQDMDAAGIDMQVLSHFSIDEGRDAIEAAHKAAMVNECLSKIVEKYPKRFAAFASISLQDPENAARELERTVKDLGLVGTMLFCLSSIGFFDSKKYWGIFETAEKLDVPIYIHPDAPPEVMIERYMPYPILAGALWGFAVEAGLQAMRLICSGIFDVYPNLKIILGHMGEVLPFLLWRIDNRWLHMDMKTKKPDPIVDRLKKKPGQYFKENFYITTSGVFWKPALQLSISALGSERILFAVDYPPESCIDAVKFIETVSIHESDREYICHLNAERLFKLKT